MNTFHHENSIQKELYKMAEKKVKKRRDFYVHVFIYLIGVAVWLLKTYTNAPLHFFPIKYINWFVMAIWTVAIVIQTIELLFSELVFGKKWEDKQIKSIMEEESQKQNWE